MALSDDPVQVIREYGMQGRGKNQVVAEGYEINLDITQLANAFKITWTPGGIATQRKSLQVQVGNAPPSAPATGYEEPLLSGDFVRIAVEGTTVLRGRVDMVFRETSPEVNEMAAIGRNYGYALVDNAVPIDYNFVSSSISIAALAKLLIKGTVIGGPVQHGAINSMPMYAAPEPGESRAEMLTRYLVHTDSLAWIDVDGNLAVGKTSSGKAVGTLKLGQNVSNVIACTVRRAPALVLTKVSVLFPNWLAQGEEAMVVGVLPDQMGVASQEKDPRLAGFSRYGVIQGSAYSTMLVPGEAMQVANLALARSKQEMLQVQATIPGHSIDGVVPWIDQVWHVQHKDEAIDDDLYLKAVRFWRERGNPKNTRTVLTFVEKNTVVSGFIGPQFFGPFGPLRPGGGTTPPGTPPPQP